MVGAQKTPCFLYGFCFDVLLQVVLDLDETLVCAYEKSSLPAALCTQATEAGVNWFELECVSSDKVCYLINFF